jgi:hypothetical protein
MSIMNNTAGAVVDSFTNVILQAINLAIPRGAICKPKYPNWFAS